MRAKQVPRDCGNELVSPSGESNYDCHKEASEQLKPIGANDGVEDGQEENANEDDQGLGHDVAMGDEMKEGTDASGGGASSAPAPGVRRKRKGDEEGAEEEGEEGREARRLPIPNGPSKEEREKHNLTHTPYRSWCPHCVRARGRNTPHRKGEKESESLIPRISFDYFFLTKEDESGNKNPMIAMVDENTGEKYARSD